MVCGERRLQLLLRLRAVVEHLVLLAHERAHLCEQLLGGQRLQGVVRQRRAGDELRTVHHVALQGAEVAALAELAVGAALHGVLLHVGEDRLVGLCSDEQPLDDLHRLGHVLAQARDRDPRLVGAGLHRERAGDVVHLRGDLLGAHLRGAEVAHVVEGHAQLGIVLRAGVEDVDQREDVVHLVLLVEHVYARHGVELRHVGRVVHEDGLDGLHGALLDRGQEVALLVAVRDDRGDLRSGDLLHALVLALTLVDDGVALLAQVLVGPVDDILLRDLGHAVELVHLVGPVGAVDERVGEGEGAAVVVLGLPHELHLVVVDRCLDELLVEVARAQLGHLREQQVAHLVERLPGLRAACDDELSVVGLRRGVAVGHQDLLLLHEVEVDQTGLSVIDDAAHDVGHVP